MKGIAMTAATFLAASVALAEPVRVLSGEHSDFTRIVLVFEDDVDWIEKRISDGYLISFDRSDLDLDLGNVFSKIPRTRVKEVAFDSSSSTLLLQSDCACELSIFWAEANALALDVKTSSKHAIEAAAARIEPTDADPKPRITATEQAFPFGLPKGRPYGLATGASSPIAEGAISEAASDPGRSTPRLGGESRAHVQRMEEALFEQLGRAASLGVAKLSFDAAGVPSTRSALSDPLNDRSLGVQSHIRTRTVFDTSESPDSDASRSDEHGPVCFGEHVLDVASWVSEPNAARAISLARERLVSEFDTPGILEVESLVRTYLAFGFGAEARAAMEEFGFEEELTPLYMLMADIVDQNDIRNGMLLAGSTACDGPSALWALAASDHLVPLADVNGRSVVAWFVRLPDPLRFQLGPKLVEGLMTSGNPDKAVAVRDAIIRTSDRPISELRIVDARASLEEGNVDAAFAELGSVTAENSPQSLPATISLLQGMRKAQRLEAEAVLSAEAIAFEYRKTEAGLQLLEEVSLSWSQLGNFEAAWRVWDEVRTATAERPSPDPSFSRLVQDLVENGKDGDLMALLHSESLQAGDPSLTRTATLNLAEWFVENANPDAAMSALARYRGENTLDIRHLQARLALLNNEPSLALSYVSAEEDLASLSLKAQALERLGEFGAAAKVYERADREDDARWARAMDAQQPKDQSNGRRNGGAIHQIENEVSVPSASDAVDAGYSMGAGFVSGEPVPASASSEPPPQPEEITISGSRQLVEHSRSARRGILVMIDGGFSFPDRELE